MMSDTLGVGRGSVARETGGARLAAVIVNGRVLKVSGRWSAGLGIFFGRPGPRLCSGTGRVVGYDVSAALSILGAVGCLVR